MSPTGLPIETERLILRPWRESDFASFAALNADRQVMEHFPDTLNRAQSDALALRMKERIETEGLGFFAVEVKGGPGFIGMVGPSVPAYGAELPCGPCTEVGWRLSRDAWGKGYASEAAVASLDFAFGVLGREEVVAFTAVQNARSQAVMRRIGMTRDESGDFDHPLLPAGHRLLRHVLYRISRKTWEELRSR
ncbi:GNAT family N-acetyltransferase [Thalassobaculum sp. OXR-137]|uniref:GNAT family N-acetyltransferase n=1 Tax=Thalassobaculum sp. OXR-137 TaxID=3100173 RepID=UPI002AC95581|nr:GNAT family N-acetyltransferase [Thalassobaculum sp. OXR-137]WPZ33417.1 GNAT family N-acetyltransferase [Thalassobaculum sp. OXR-137]